jgi:hypothetical protein
MNKFALVGSVTLLLLTTISPVSAGPNCTDFMSNADGSWSPTHVYIYATPTSQTRLMPTDKMLPQMSCAQGQLAGYLNARCRSERSTVSQGRIPRIP